jgi:hypothetical protein
VQDLDSDALRRELVKDHIEALKRRRADEEKRQKEVAVAAFKALLERSSLKASSSWRKVQTKIQDTEEYEVCVWVSEDDCVLGTSAAHDSDDRACWCRC